MRTTRQEAAILPAKVAPPQRVVDAMLSGTAESMYVFEGLWRCWPSSHAYPYVLESNNSSFAQTHPHRDHRNSISFFFVLRSDPASSRAIVRTATMSVDF